MIPIIVRSHDLLFEQLAMIEAGDLVWLGADICARIKGCKLRFIAIDGLSAFYWPLVASGKWAAFTAQIFGVLERVSIAYSVPVAITCTALSYATRFVNERQKTDKGMQGTAVSALAALVTVVEVKRTGPSIEALSSIASHLKFEEIGKLRVVEIAQDCSMRTTGVARVYGEERVDLNFWIDDKGMQIDYGIS